jgi:ribosome-binding factor A
METKKQQQLAEIVKRHFGLLLLEEGKHIVGVSVLVSVTTVKITPDQSLAKIYLSVFNAPDKSAVFQALNEHMPLIKSSFYQRIRKQMRRMPDIALYPDDTIDEMYRVEAMMQRLRSEGQFGQPEND